MIRQHVLLTPSRIARTRAISSKSHPPALTPYHHLFNLPPHSNPYTIDPSILKQRFLKAQQTAHPDAWSGKGKAAQAKAAADSATINRAYETLLSPLKRAEYLLSLRGFEVKEEDKLDDDPELLMEIMEAQEEIQDAESREEALAALEANQEKVKQLKPVIEDAFGSGDLDQAKKATIRLRYWEKTLRAAKQAVDQRDLDD